MQRIIHSLLVMLLLVSLVRAEPPPTEPSFTVSQGPIRVLVDPSHQLTLEQVRAAYATGQFRAIPGNLGLGYTPDVVWLHLSIERRAEQSSAGWLEIMPPYLDDVQLFHIRPDGTIDARRGGDRLPQSAKEEDYRGNLFKLALQPGEHELYLRLQTTSTMAAIVKLWQPDRFERHLRLDYFVYGLYFSLILTVLLFNAVNWLVSRRRIFLVYVGYLFLNALQWLGINGFVAEFIFPAQPLLANLTLGMSLSLAGAMAFGFFIMVLELKQYHTVLYRISLSGLVLGIVTALATPLGYYSVFAPWFLALCIISLCGIPWPTRRLWRTGDLWARLLAVAYITYGLLVTINILGVLAVLPFGEGINIAGMTSNIAHILLLHFAILLHSGYSKLRAFQLNLISSFASVAGGILGYFTLQTMQSWIPSLLALAAASMIYVAVADLIPGLHKRAQLRDTVQQVLLIVSGVGTVWLMSVLMVE